MVSGLGSGFVVGVRVAERVHGTCGGDRNLLICSCGLTLRGVWRGVGGEEGEQRLAGQRCAAKGGERAHHAEVLPG